LFLSTFKDEAIEVTKADFSGFSALCGLDMLTQGLKSWRRRVGIFLTRRLHCAGSLRLQCSFRGRSHKCERMFLSTKDELPRQILWFSLISRRSSQNSVANGFRFCGAAAAMIFGVMMDLTRQSVFKDESTVEIYRFWRSRTSHFALLSPSLLKFEFGNRTSRHIPKSFKFSVNFCLGTFGCQWKISRSLFCLT
jgi:hypothetical protein